MDKKSQEERRTCSSSGFRALRQQLAGARKQMDDREELKSIEQQLAAAETELAKVKDA